MEIRQKGCHFTTTGGVDDDKWLLQGCRVAVATITPILIGSDMYFPGQCFILNHMLNESLFGFVGDLGRCIA
jgi:hypothetical protein